MERMLERERMFLDLTGSFVGTIIALSAPISFLFPVRLSFTNMVFWRYAFAQCSGCLCCLAGAWLPPFKGRVRRNKGGPGWTSSFSARSTSCSRPGSREQWGQGLAPSVGRDGDRVPGCRLGTRAQPGHGSIQGVTQQTGMLSSPFLCHSVSQIHKYF